MSNSVTKLLNIPSSHAVFENNQVLTAGQLNKITDYLDTQNRLTRVKLIGVGILSGLEVDATKEGITLSRGIAITTDGDLFNVESNIFYDRLVPFEDKNAQYPYFRSENKPITMYEMIPSTAKAKKTITWPVFLKKIKEKTSDYVGVLYLEHYLYDPDICSGTDCDNLGKEEIMNLKFLIIPLKEMGKIAATLPVLNQSLFQMKKYQAVRVILTTSNTESYSDYINQYLTVINSTAPSLIEQLKKSYTACSPLLSEIYDDQDPTTVWDKMISKIAESASSNKTKAQYVYDFLLDLAHAYNEFRETVFETQGWDFSGIRKKLAETDPRYLAELGFKLNLLLETKTSLVRGNPLFREYGFHALGEGNIALFPKHILLGLLTPGDNESAGALRHTFYPSPALSDGVDRIAHARFLHLKIHKMIHSFSLPKEDVSVKITPSKSPVFALSERSIPFYYRHGEDIMLYKYWNYSSYRRNDPDNILSYNADKYSDIKFVENPLDYDLSGYDFFRVEGHIGKKADEAVQIIQAYIRNKNLPIKVIPLQVNNILTGLRPLPILPNKFYTDLHRMHFLLRNDISSKFREAMDYTEGLRNTMITTAEKSDKEREFITPYMENANRHIDQMNSNIGEAMSNLNQTTNNFDHQAYSTSVQRIIKTAGDIQAGIRAVSSKSSNSPLDSIVASTNFYWLGWISELIKEKEVQQTKARQLEDFLRDHPGLEHKAGVDSGGTFILVYGALGENVLGDLALPYYVYEPVEEESEEKPAPGGFVKPKWPDFNIVDVGSKIDQSLVHKQISDLNDKIIQQAELTDIYKTTANYINDYYKKTIDKMIKTPDITNENIGIDNSYTDPVSGYLAGIYTYQKNVLEKLREKELAGTLTDDERVLKETVEKEFTENMKNAVNTAGNLKSDIAADSDHAKILSIFEGAASLVSNEKLVTDMKKTLNNITVNSRFSNLSSSMNKIRIGF